MPAVFPDTIPVVIGSSYNAYGILRSFYERGIKSILVSPDGAHCFVEYSKYCGKYVTVADPNHQPEQFVADLIALGKFIAPRRGMFFPTHDEQIFVIDQYRSKLETYFDIPYSNMGICMQLMDKAHLNQLCQSLQIPTIKERLVSEFPQAISCLKELRLPLIVKLNVQDAKHISALGDKIRIFRQESEYLASLSCFFEKMPGASLLVQEYIEDSDVLMPTINCVSDYSGNILCTYAAEKVRQYPLETGTSTSYRVLDPSLPQVSLLNSYVQKILAAVHYYGLSGSEFKYDPQTGKYKIIEINLRSEFPNYLQTLAGCNMPYLLYQYHLTGKYDPAKQSIGQEAMCYLPVSDYMHAVHLNKMQYGKGVLSRREWKRTITSSHTWYGLHWRDFRACFYALITTALQMGNAYLRIKLRIPQNISTKDYLLGKRDE